MIVFWFVVGITLVAGSSAVEYAWPRRATYKNPMGRVANRHGYFVVKYVLRAIFPS